MKSLNSLEKSESKNGCKLVSARNEGVCLPRTDIIVSPEEQHIGDRSHTNVSLKFHHAPWHSSQTPFASYTFRQRDRELTLSELVHEHKNYSSLVLIPPFVRRLSPFCRLFCRIFCYRTITSKSPIRIVLLFGHVVRTSRPRESVPIWADARRAGVC